MMPDINVEKGHRNRCWKRGEDDVENDVERNNEGMKGSKRPVWYVSLELLLHMIGIDWFHLPVGTQKCLNQSWFCILVLTRAIG